MCPTKPTLTRLKTNECQYADGPTKFLQTANRRAHLFGTDAIHKGFCRNIVNHSTRAFPPFSAVQKNLHAAASFSEAPHFTLYESKGVEKSSSEAWIRGAVYGGYSWSFNDDAFILFTGIWGVSRQRPTTEKAT